MKSEEKSIQLEAEKAELIRLVAEVKAIVASIILLPLEKKVSLATAA